MFKKFDTSTSISGQTNIKSSTQRAIRAKLIEQMPVLGHPIPSTSKIESGIAGLKIEAEEDEQEVSEEKESKKGGKGKKDKATKSKGSKGTKGKGAAGEGEEAAGEGEAGSEVKEEAPTLLEAIWPKKETLTLVKCRDHLSILALNGQPLFFQSYEGSYFPTLRLLHLYPALIPHVQVDRGAIKFVLGGANVMSPGLISKGAILPPGIPQGAVVAIHAEGKEHALAIGTLASSSDEIAKVKKGLGVEVATYVGDDGWPVTKV